jgi:cytosine permease
VSLLGWFGINLNLFGLAIAGLSKDFFNAVPPELGVTVGASVLITATTIIGFRAINLVSTLMIPVLVFVAVALLFAAMGHSEPIAHIVPGGMSLGDGISAIVGSIVIGAIIMPDITRFLRSWQGAVITGTSSYLIAQPFVMWVAAAAALALGTQDIISIMLTLGLGVGAFIIIIAGSWVLNTLNLYSAVLGVTASFPSLNARQVTVVLGVIGVSAGLLNILDSFVTFLFYLSVVFIPVAGVIIIDHFLIRPSVYRVTQVEDDQPINRPALVAWLAGAAIALAGAEGLIASITSVAALDSAIASGLIYALVTRVWKVRP